MALDSGTILGPYQILAPLGAGGMGEVYRARDTRLQRDVAIKVLPESFARDAERLRRFEQEARAVAALNHPNILAVHDIGAQDGTHYIVTELLDGRSLREQLDELRGGALPMRKTIDYTRQICEGLAAAHNRGIVHRDLKPDNIFCTREGRIKILDFGLAKQTPAASETATVTGDVPLSAQTQPGMVMGTVGYMSPEQVRGAPTDHRSDIFSLGAILYEMLSGRRAFRRETTAETMTAILREEPAELTGTNAALSPGLQRIVHRCLEKEPTQRFQSAADLGFALEALSGSAGATSGATTGSGATPGTAISSATAASAANASPPATIRSGIRARSTLRQRRGHLWRDNGLRRNARHRNQFGNCCVRRERIAARDDHHKKMAAGHHRRAGAGRAGRRMVRTQRDHRTQIRDQFHAGHFPPRHGLFGAPRIRRQHCGLHRGLGRRTSGIICGQQRSARIGAAQRQEWRPPRGQPFRGIGHPDRRTFRAPLRV